MSEPIVFLIDDDEVDRKHMVRILKGAGFEVQECGDSDSFLESFDANQVGCAVIDVRLPGLDGPGLHKILLEKDGQMPVILVSGVATVSVATTGMRMGALDVLEKPVDREALVSAVTRGVDLSTKLNLRRNAAKKINEQVKMLTNEEQQVLPYICEGYPIKAIAAKLHVGFVDAARHQSSIFEKLCVCNAIELIKRLETSDIQMEIAVEA